MKFEPASSYWCRPDRVCRDGDGIVIMFCSVYTVLLSSYYNYYFSNTVSHASKMCMVRLTTMTTDVEEKCTKKLIVAKSLNHIYIENFMLNWCLSIIRFYETRNVIVVSSLMWFVWSLCKSKMKNVLKWTIGTLKILARFHFYIIYLLFAKLIYPLTDTIAFFFLYWHRINQTSFLNVDTNNAATPF